MGPDIEWEADARENLHGSAIDLEWIDAVPRPKPEPREAEMFFREKRSVLSAFFTALIVLGTFTVGALFFASLAFDAMGIHP